MRLFPLSSDKEQQDNGGSNGALVYLNIYDLTPVNNYLYWFGLGIFHSGIEVHGMEFGFGAHEYSSSGVFEVEPRSCPGFIYRAFIVTGKHQLISFRSSFIHGTSFCKISRDTYHLIAKNCNHFTDEVCTQLTGKPIPGWVNRLARVDDDGLESMGSSLSLESEGEDSDHHLLTVPNGDVAFLKEKPVKLARELM